ncbi:MAG: MATE family efflux transporter, partial [Eubacteriales bacterium]|nr:MATE family efflux transporter [Eubacteriales bacterium]
MLGIKITYLVRIIKLGTSNFINQIIMMVVNITLNNMLAKYGAQSIYGSEIPLAVSGVVAKLNSIMSSFSVGLAQGCQPIWGFNLGAKNYDRVRETYRKALSVAI